MNRIIQYDYINILFIRNLLNYKKKMIVWVVDKKI